MCSVYAYILLYCCNHLQENQRVQHPKAEDQMSHIPDKNTIVSACGGRRRIAPDVVRPSRVSTPHPRSTRGRPAEKTVPACRRGTGPSAIEPHRPPGRRTTENIYQGQYWRPYRLYGEGSDTGTTKRFRGNRDGSRVSRGGRLLSAKDDPSLSPCRRHTTKRVCM